VVLASRAILPIWFPQNDTLLISIFRFPQSFTVGKIDAGIAVLIGPTSHLIEFPSLLLPPGCQPGSIVCISCSRAYELERDAQASFLSLQEAILSTYGTDSPEAPDLQLLNVTQTSVTLSWSPLKLANAKLHNLAIYRNNTRIALIPNPLHNVSTKLSGLELDTDYTFHLVLKTSAGTYTSQQLRVRTHTIDNTSGISVCFGNVEPPELRDEAEAALRRMGAKWNSLDKIAVDTTHFVCTGPGQGGDSVQFQRALQMSIPTVHPRWVTACETEKRMVGVAKYYLGNVQEIQAQSQDSIQAQAQRRRAGLESTTSVNAQNREEAASAPAPAESQGSSSSNATAVPQQQQGDAADVPTDAPPSFESAIADTQGNGRQGEETIEAAANEEPSLPATPQEADETPAEEQQEKTHSSPIPIIKVDDGEVRDEEDDEAGHLEQDEVGSLDEIKL
jgi:hypothetical protein